jgi:hypothetical protein
MSCIQYKLGFWSKVVYTIKVSLLQLITTKEDVHICLSFMLIC